MIETLIGVVVASIFFAGGYYLNSFIASKNLSSAKVKAEAIVKEAKLQAEADAKSVMLETKEKATAEANEILNEADRKRRYREQEIEQREKRLRKQEDKLNYRLDSLDEKHTEIDKKKKDLEKLLEENETFKKVILVELERISQLTSDQAKQEILRQVAEKSEYECAQLRKQIEEQTKQEAMQEARKIIVKALGRCTFDHYADNVITSVPIKSEDVKGRIIGREGRNIKSFEQVTGVDLIIDDTPNVISISSFDPIRREIARIALERLIIDGRIQPIKIESTVEKVTAEMDEIVWTAGQEASFSTNISGIHPELIKLLGRLKFRTSYGQNVLKHSMEVSHLSGLIAAELGLNPKLAKRGGLLHDIGKAVDVEMEGSHQFIGMEMAKKYGEHPVVINCIGSHHGDLEQTIEAAIVQIADSISGARPGARGESLESYIQRMKKLEDLVLAFEGVNKCFAVQAGRELRVMVAPDTLDDVLTHHLCSRLAVKIQKELEYPGMIKITVIRELRDVSYAK